MRLALSFTAAAFIGLAGCELQVPDAAAPPGLAPEQSVTPVPRPEVASYVPSPASQALRRYYTRIEQDQMTRGLMRVDGGGPDTPFDTRNVVDNFITVALFNEHSSGLSRGAPVASNLRRWAGPVRLGLTHGASVAQADRSTQTSLTRNYASRLAAITGHPISYETAQPNFHILVLDEDERQAAAPLMRALIPGMNDATIRTIQSMPREVHCLVVAFSAGGTSTYSQALAVIRSEHPPASWLSCLHEEVAQGLGLPNDSRRARPSIFNDDEEFALLTSHDEFLLRILYDSRMRTGMTAQTARPTAEVIAAELMAPGSL